MTKEELVKKLQELRAKLQTSNNELVRGALKDTTVIGKTKLEIAQILTKLNVQENGK